MGRPIGTAKRVRHALELFRIHKRQTYARFIGPQKTIQGTVKVRTNNE